MEDRDRAANGNATREAIERRLTDDVRRAEEIFLEAKEEWEVLRERAAPGAAAALRFAEARYEGARLAYKEALEALLNFIASGESGGR